MTEPRTPLLLRIWLIATRLLAGPYALLSRSLHRRMGAAPERFAERLGRPSQSTPDQVIWVHAASLGEVSQTRTLVARLQSSEDAKILVTTTTAAGAEWAARELPDAIHQFVPLDTPSAVRGFLDAWQISVAVFIEGDLFPRLTLETQRRGIPQLLLNARHSRTRERFPAVFATLLSGFQMVTCRSEDIAGGMRALGLSADQIKVLPDLRTATAKLPCPPEPLAELTAQIGDRPIWLAASTHAADEAAVLAAHEAVLSAHPDALLILAPRHPKRAEALVTQAKTRALELAQRSSGDAISPHIQVYLADTLGELGLFFSLAPLAFIGGSFGDEGGHNPYEPASLGTAILSGPRVKNFADAYDALTKAGAATLVHDPATLGEQVLALLQPGAAARMGQAGLAFMAASEDGLAETVRIISDARRRH